MATTTPAAGDDEDPSRHQERRTDQGRSCDLRTSEGQPTAATIGRGGSGPALRDREGLAEPNFLVPVGARTTDSLDDHRVVPVSRWDRTDIPRAHPRRGHGGVQFDRAERLGAIGSEGLDRQAGIVRHVDRVADAAIVLRPGGPHDDAIDLEGDLGARHETTDVVGGGRATATDRAHRGAGVNARPSDGARVPAGGDVGGRLDDGPRGGLEMDHSASR